MLHFVIWEKLTQIYIVDFDVVIIDPIAGINVPHRQSGGRGGTHSASLRSALLPSPASSQPRELVSGRHLPLPEAVGRPRPPRLAACPAALFVNCQLTVWLWLNSL